MCRQTWGTNAGQVDETTLYKVHNCGPKMATLHRVDKNTLQPNGYRGHTIYISTREQVEELNRQQQQRTGYRQFKFWDWSQLFVSVGEAGWDAAENF